MQDALLQFSDGQALTATAASTNVIDTTSARQIADGMPMIIALFPSVSADITTGDETYSVALQTDDNSAFSSATTLATFTVTAAQLAAGKVAYFGLPAQGLYERYLRLNYTLGGTSPSVTLDAFLAVMDSVSKYGKYYASGFTIA